MDSALNIFHNPNVSAWEGVVGTNISYVSGMPKYGY